MSLPQKRLHLKIVSNTKYKSAATKVYVDDLLPRLRNLGHQVVANDWDHYQNYDVALFASPDAQVQQAKRSNPNILTGIMDPKIDKPKLQENVRTADFITVTSLEQRDALMEFNQNIFIYFAFPNIPELQKKHTTKNITTIGYHGNREHLICMYPTITRALDAISKDYNIELRIIYNYKTHGRWTRNLPKKIPVKHIQWHPNIYEQELRQIDIGIVNNNIPMSRGHLHLITAPLTRYLKLQLKPYRRHDTLIRYKYSANPGRLYPFSQSHIPVVADFTPSLSYFIGHNERGLLAHTQAGWENALKQFIASKNLRQKMANNLNQFINNHHHPDKMAEQFSHFISNHIKT